MPHIAVNAAIQTNPDGARVINLLVQAGGQW